MSAQTHTAARAQKLLRRKGALTPLILVMGFIGASLAGHAACRGLDARRLAHIEQRREAIHRAHATRRAKVMREADRAKGQARNAFAQEWGKDCEGNPTVEDSSPEDEEGKR